MNRLLDLLIDWWAALQCWRIIRSYQRGVRFVLGIDTEELGPGFHWRVPFRDEIEVVDVVSDVLDLPVQSITTKDRHEIAFSANIGYRISDARLHFTAVQDFHNSLSGAARNHLARKVREWTLAELYDEQRALERSLRETLTTRLRAWGVEVEDVGVTDLVVARHYRLFTDTTILH